MLFDRWAIGNMELANRFVRSGTSEFASDPAGFPGEALKTMYVDLAKGGTGLIVTGYAYIREDGRSDMDQNALHTDELIEPWRAITAAVHEASPESRIAAQLVHGGRQCKPSATCATFAPSAVHDPRSGITPRAMTTEEIEGVIESFAASALRAKRAGFDAVQLHAAHGYLISQFLSPHTNRRTDEWGGSVSKRARFAVEVLRACRDAVGESYPLCAKLNCTDLLPSGIGLEQVAETAAILADAGLGAIELSAWMYEAPLELSPSRKGDLLPSQEAYFLHEARAAKRDLPKDFPVGLCGGIRSRAVMERLLEEGFAFMALSRPFIAEPDLVKRMHAGQPRVACDSCNECIEGERHPIVNCPPVREGRLYERIEHPEWATLASS